MFVCLFVCLFVCSFGFLTSSSTTRLYRGQERLTIFLTISAGHIIQTPTQPVGSGRPQRESNPGPPHQESRALLQSYRAQAQTYIYIYKYIYIIIYIYIYIYTGKRIEMETKMMMHANPQLFQHFNLKGKF